MKRTVAKKRYTASDRRAVVIRYRSFIPFQPGLDEGQRGPLCYVI